MDLNMFCETPSWEWPQDAGAFFLEVLNSAGADESERITAAGLAGDYLAINDELAHALLVIAGDGRESVELRARAALSLGPVLEGAFIFGFDDPELVPITERTYDAVRTRLRELYSDESAPEEVRRRALEASVRSPAEWHREAVSAAYSRGEEDWRLTAVFCMQFVGGFEGEILEALESENADFRYEAVLAAGAHRLDAAWPHIVSILSPRETDKDLVLAAIESAVEIRPEESEEVLSALVDSEDVEISDAALDAVMLLEELAGEDESEDE